MSQAGDALTVMAEWFGRRARALRGLKREFLTRAGDLMTSDFQRNIIESTDPDGAAYPPLAHPRLSGGSKPLLATGKLYSGFREQVSEDSVTVTNVSPLAPVHNAGALIAPVRARMLAIPLTLSAMAAGSPRNVPGLSPRYGARGGVLVDKSGVAQFALTRGPVRVPKRQFMGFGPRLIRLITELAQSMLAKAAGKA